MAHLDEARRQQGLPPLRFGAALHLGEMPWGNIGAADRLDFTAIGSAVNLVSRLEGLCRLLDKTVLVSGPLAVETGVPLIPLGTHPLRGYRIAMRRLHRARELGRLADHVKFHHTSPDLRQTCRSIRWRARPCGMC